MGQIPVYIAIGELSSMAFVLDEQTSEMKTKSLMTGTRNLKFQDGEDVDVLRRPGFELEWTVIGPNIHLAKFKHYA